MAIPAAGTAWPPKALDDIIPKMCEWDALWVGTPEALSGVYQTHRRSSNFPEMTRNYGGRAIDAVVRFWARDSTDTSVGPLKKSHVPIGSDIAQASSDLLYADPPEITSDDEATQLFIDGLIEAGLFTTMSSAAEVGAALGGSYRRAVWDTNRGVVFSTRVDADMALPVFDYGRLVEVTFWSTVSHEGEQVVRHLEHHSLDSRGLGIIQHQRFRGTTDNLGERVDVEGPLAGLLTGFGKDTILTGSPGLAVVYVPNQVPNRVWRKNPVGANLGRSDFDGVEIKMDELDEAFSSLMHELDIAKAKVIVPAYMLEQGKAGQGVTFDGDRSIFTTLNMPPGEGNPPVPLVVQPAIRVDEHLRIMQELTEVILRSAGYSLQTFGEDESGGAATATEITSRDRRSSLTRSRKIRHEQPALLELVVKMLALANTHLGQKLRTDGVRVEFPKAASSTPLENAQIVQFLAVAEAASIETKVRTVHPEWDDKAVDDEVTRIKGDKPAATDPEQFGFGGAGVSVPDVPTE